MKIAGFCVCYTCASVLVMPETDASIDENEEIEVWKHWEQIAEELNIEYLAESMDRIDEFSHVSCDICGSRIGGERYEIIGYIYNERIES